MLAILNKFLSGNCGLSTELIFAAAASLGIKAGGMILGLLLAVILARNLGTEGYGVYSYVFSLVSLIAIPAQIGLPNLLVRETAKIQVNEEWALMRGLWRWATLSVVVVSLLLAVIALTLGALFSGQFSSIQLATFAFGLMLVPLVALGNLRDAALRGLRRIVMGQLSESILRPGILIVLLLVAALYLSPETLSPSFAMGLHVVAAAISFVIGAFLLWKMRPAELAVGPEPKYTSRVWLAAALPLALVTGMQLINQNTDIIMLGYFENVEQVGIYKVAVIGSSLVAFGLQAITMATMPHFARIYAQGEMEKLQRLVTLSARVVLLLTLPIVILYVLFGDVVLLYVFGAEYISGWQPLVILSAGQLINALMGSVAALLTMTGHERDTVRGVAVAAIVNVILNFILIPLFGMYGAAVATALSFVVWNLILWSSVRRRLGIESMAFRLLPQKAPL